MKDIDFDELDRAVSSVLGQKVSATNEANDQPIVSGATTTDNQPSANATDTPPLVAADTPKLASPSLAAKRRGKFMDVMHPSADMSSQVKPVASLPEHVTTRLEPLSSDSKPEENDSPSEENSSTTEPVVEHKAEPIAALDESNALIGAEPAPVENPLVTPSEEATSEKTDGSLDTAEATEADTPLAAPTEANPEESTTEESIDTNTEAEVSPTSLASTLPQPTPFLTDTKVDKRPLGGFVDNEAATTETELPQAEAEPDSTDVQSAPVVPLPRELQSDVVQVESVQENDDSGQNVQSGPFAANVGVAAETPDDGRVEGHPLFDTSTYHEPIQTVHENSIPAWLKWLLGLTVCLALGAGVGFFLFNAGI